MKTITITGIMADFLDSIRAYEHESGSAITFDERESSEFVDMYFNNGGKLKIEEEKTLEDYEQMLFENDHSMTFSPKSAYFSVYGWIKDNEPKLYYTKILQLIADHLHDGRYIHIRGNTSYHLSNAHGVNVHCGGDEGAVYFKSNKLAIKARDILGGKVEYLFNQV